MLADLSRCSRNWGALCFHGAWTSPPMADASHRERTDQGRWKLVADGGRARNRQCISWPMKIVFIWWMWRGKCDEQTTSMETWSWRKWTPDPESSAEYGHPGTISVLAWLTAILQASE